MNKVMWNSVISTPGTKYLCADIKHFILNPTWQVRIHENANQAHPPSIHWFLWFDTQGKKGLSSHENPKGNVWVTPIGHSIELEQVIERATFGTRLLQVATHTSLFTYTTRPIWFTLFVDNVGIKYSRKEHANHLLKFLREHYSVEVDWNGVLYCRITLKWNYDDKYVDISMPDYVKKTRTIQVTWIPSKVMLPVPTNSNKPRPKLWWACRQDREPPSWQRRWKIYQTSYW